MPFQIDITHFTKQIKIKLAHLELPLRLINSLKVKNLENHYIYLGNLKLRFSFVSTVNSHSQNKALGILFTPAISTYQLSLIEKEEMAKSFEAYQIYTSELIDFLLKDHNLNIEFLKFTLNRLSSKASIDDHPSLIYIQHFLKINAYAPSQKYGFTMDGSIPPISFSGDYIFYTPTCKEFVFLLEAQKKIKEFLLSEEKEVLYYNSYYFRDTLFYEFYYKDILLQLTTLENSLEFLLKGGNISKRIDYQSAIPLATEINYFLTDLELYNFLNPDITFAKKEIKKTIINSKVAEIFSSELLKLLDNDVSTLNQLLLNNAIIPQPLPLDTMMYRLDDFYFFISLKSPEEFNILTSNREQALSSVHEFLQHKLSETLTTTIN